MKYKHKLNTNNSIYFLLQFYMSNLTESANKYLNIFKKSFKKEDDYDIFMKWLSLKISNKDKPLNKGLIIVSNNDKSNSIINLLNILSDENVIKTNHIYDNIDDNTRIITIDNLDDAKLRRISYAYKFDEFHNLNGTIIKNKFDFIVFSNIKKIDNYDFKLIEIDSDLENNIKLNQDDIKSIF